MRRSKKPNRVEDERSTQALDVFRGETFAGRLSRTPRGVEFSFDSKFLQSSKYAFLSFKIPKSAAPYKFEGSGLPPYFAGLLPEGWRFSQLVRGLKTSEDDLFSVFAALGSGVVGDVHVKEDADKFQAHLEDVDFYELLQRSVREVDMASQTGFAGVQDKISTSMISFPMRIADQKLDFILKLNPKDKPDLVENEYHCLKLASAVGIPTNKARIVHDKNNKPGLLVTRFDSSVRNGKKVMLHQEDMLQLMDRFPADKYRVTMQDVVDTIVEVSPSAKVETLKLLRLCIFNFLIGNGDFHAKNISLFWQDDHGPRVLTPAYDLVSTTVYGDHKMALKLDGKDEAFTRKHILKFATRNGLPEKAVERMLSDLLKKLAARQGLLEQVATSERSRTWLISSFAQKAKRLA